MKYYEVSLVIAIDDQKLGWDSSCDETFGIVIPLMSSIGTGGVKQLSVTDYIEISENEFFNTKEAGILTPEGGI